MARLSKSSMKHLYVYPGLSCGLTFLSPFSFWSGVEMGPPDAIIGVNEAFKRDSNPKKMNLGVGAYRDDEGKPFVLPSVRKAEKKIAGKQMNHEYTTIPGDTEYTRLAAELAFGPGNDVTASGRNATFQSISGTGALRLGAEFLRSWHNTGPKKIYLPAPSWANHNAIFSNVGLEVGAYRYYDKATCGFDFEGAKEDIKVRTILSSAGDV